MKWFVLDLSANEIDMIFTLKNNPGPVRIHDWKLMEGCEEMFAGYRVPETA